MRSVSTKAMVEVIKEKKAALRARIEKVIKDMTVEEVRRQSAEVVQKVLKHPRYTSARSVSLYLSFGSEIETDPIVRDVFARGKSCYVPRYGKGSPDMQMVQLQSLEDLASLPVNRWNIRQPRVDEHRPSVFDANGVDVVLLPGVAFSLSGARLGHGKGYYDRFLGRCFRDLPPGGRPFTVGLALREQVLSEDEIPLELTDHRLDLVICADPLDQIKDLST